MVAVAVAGSAPLGFQWTCNGTNLTDDGRIADRGRMFFRSTAWRGGSRCLPGSRHEYFRECDERGGVAGRSVAAGGNGVAAKWLGAAGKQQPIDDSSFGHRAIWFPVAAQWHEYSGRGKCFGGDDFDGGGAGPTARAMGDMPRTPRCPILWGSPWIHLGTCSSRNESRSAQVTGLEWNVRVSGARNLDVIDKFARRVRQLLAGHATSSPYDPTEFEDEAIRAGRSDRGPLVLFSPTEVRLEPFQERLLELIGVSRASAVTTATCSSLPREPARP